MKDEAIHVLSIEDNLVEVELIQEKLAEAQRVGWDLPCFAVEHVQPFLVGGKMCRVLVTTSRE